MITAANPSAAILTAPGASPLSGGAEAYAWRSLGCDCTEIPRAEAQEYKTSRKYDACLW
jgi:hypothetical protein